MKKALPAFVAGLLVGILAVSPALAQVITAHTSIEVDPINIMVNGEVFVPHDVTGAEVPVFVYQGTTYAPLRALAEAYGLEVGYDKEKKLATVGQSQRAAEENQGETNTEYEKLKSIMNTSFAFDPIRSGDKAVDVMLTFVQTDSANYWNYLRSPNMVSLFEQLALELKGEDDLVVNVDVIDNLGVHVFNRTFSY